MKIGDKVRFVSEIGGGIIVAFRDNKTVLVEDADGFEIPMLMKDCVVVSSTNESVIDEPNLESNESEKKAKVDFNKNVIEEKGRDVLNVYLAFSTEDIDTFFENSIDAYLINDSNYYLYYSLLSKVDKDFLCIHHGVAEPNRKIFLEEIERDNLSKWAKVVVQLIAFKNNKPMSFKPAVSKEISIDGVKFYKQNTFKSNMFFNNPALIYEVVRNDELVKSVNLDATELEKALQEKSSVYANKSNSTNSSSKKTANGIIEVDLHIEELIDNTAGMDNKSMLEYQLNVLETTLEKYKRNKGQRIVFIHGKGEGVLRKELIKLIKAKYPRYSHQDASFQEYGFGATMVTIR